MEVNRIGDLSGIVGVAISLIGFAATVTGVVRSKRAAERAEEAARAAKDSIRMFDTVVDFAAAISVLEEIKRAHRQQQWPLLPDRYSTIRKTLISIRANGNDLSDDHKTVIQNALVNLSSIEKAVERGLEDPSSLKPARFNSLLSNDIDNLMTVLVQLKTTKVGT
jgi:hypothetical protein